MRFLFVSFCVAVLIAPGIASADVWDMLEKDMDAWEETDNSMETDERRQVTEMLWQENQELFPEGLGGSSSSARPGEDRIAKFVTIVMGGSSLVLRDVPVGEWFGPFVRAIAEIGLVSGYQDTAGKPTGLFGPADPVTVGQVAKVLTTAASLEIGSCASTVVNATASGSWADPYVDCAESKGWILYADGSVDVHRPATRSEVVVTLLQAFSVSPEEISEDVFTDVTASTIFAPQIARAKKDGIVSGYTDAAGVPLGAFGPLDDVTRAEFAKIVTLGLQVYGK